LLDTLNKKISTAVRRLASSERYIMGPLESISVQRAGDTFTKYFQKESRQKSTGLGFQPWYSHLTTRTNEPGSLVNVPRCFLYIDAITSFVVRTATACVRVNGKARQSLQPR
jgi:hypothetical protein